jgi:mannose-6-phosphate isomerase-like protein (cupin superfamily)
MEVVQRRAFHLGPGEGQSVWSLGGRFTVKLDSAASDRQFSMVEALAFRSTEPPRHIHRNEDEAWYILEGAMTFHVGDDVLPATSGSFVFAPRGIPHAFTVDIEPTRVLVFASPGGFEQFALEVGEPAAGDEPPPDLAVPAPEVLGPIGHRYGIEIVGPPIRVARGEG